MDRSSQPTPSPSRTRRRVVRRAGPSLLFLALAILALPASPAEAQTLGDRFLDAAVDSVVAAHMEDGTVAGLTVAVARGGDLLHHDSHGYADLELDVPMPLDAVYEIGSVTKQFTAALVLMLVEEGVLDLDADMGEYAPAFDTGGRRVPLRRLLDHTSGIKGYTESPVFGRIVTQALPPDTLLRLMEDAPWDFEPGTALIYNNTAYFLLGRILEEATDMTYGELLEERIFEPLGMEASHLCEQGRVVENRAHGYQASPDGFVRAPYLDHRWPFAAGSICSSARDLIRWNQALHGGEVLSPEMYPLLITPEPLEDGTPVRYAKGLVNQEGPYGQVIAHGGGIFGYLTEVSHFPDEELTVVVLQNTAGPAGPGRVVEGVVELLRARVPDPEAVPFPGELEALEGSYAGPARGRAMTVEVTVEDGSLLLAPNGGEPDAVSHLGEGVFGGGGTRIWFVDSQGQVVGRPGAGAPASLRVQQASALYVLERQGG